MENTYTYFCDHTKGSESYTCHCSDGYEWNAEKKACESVCEEGYYWDILREECREDGCLNVVCGEHSDGICVRGTFDREYYCGCDENYYWDTGELKCLPEPCLTAVCGEHSDGNCFRYSSAGGYYCGCEEGYSWYTSVQACWKIDLCSNVVCGEHSTGSCTQTGADTYTCTCEDGYEWHANTKKCESACSEGYYWGYDGSQWKCMSDPCYSAVCGEHSDGICNRTSLGTYYCGCDTHYAWDSNQQKCIADPCQNPDPCENMANANGCIKLSNTEFKCACNVGSYWNGTKCEECKEIDGNMWSPVYDPKDPNTASSFCNNLSVCGYSDWKLPSVDQLRTLFQNCSRTQTGGPCGVSNRCMAESCADSLCSCASTSTDGYYSKLGDPASLYLWSRSKSSKDTYWLAGFGNASLESIQAFDNEFRCVRKTTASYDACEYQLCPTLSNTTGRCFRNSSNNGYSCECQSNYYWSGSKCTGMQIGEVLCTGLPDNAQWNTVGSITQTWNGSAYVPSTTGEYNETASTSECRFKCKNNFGYDITSNQCVGNTQRVSCTEPPANAQWNSVNSIIQTWRGSDLGWLPVTNSVYNTEASTTECRFKCYEAYTWNKATQQCVASYIGGLYWSEIAENLTFPEAAEYCWNLDNGPWRLPHIDDLRKLVQNCPGTASGGACPVTAANAGDDILNSNCSCNLGENGIYSKFGDDTYLWAATPLYHNGELIDNRRWTLDFRYARISHEWYEVKHSVRCVKD